MEVTALSFIHSFVHFKSQITCIPIPSPAQRFTTFIDKWARAITVKVYMPCQPQLLGRSFFPLRWRHGCSPSARSDPAIYFCGTGFSNTPTCSHMNGTLFSIKKPLETCSSRLPSSHPSRPLLAFWSGSQSLLTWQYTAAEVYDSLKARCSEKRTFATHAN